MAKRRITLSSKKEQEIENAYVQTPAGRVMFTLTLVACVALLVGLLIDTYKLSAWGTEFINPDSLIYTYSQQLFMWGSFAALVCMVFYIKFALDYKAGKKSTVKTTKTTKKPATKKVVKKAEPVKKNEEKPAKKTVAKKTTKTTTKKTK